MYMGIHVCAHQYVYINSVYQCALGTSQGYLKLTSGRIWGGTQEWMLPSSQVVLMLLVHFENHCLKGQTPPVPLLCVGQEPHPLVLFLLIRVRGMGQRWVSLTHNL